MRPPQHWRELTPLQICEARARAPWGKMHAVWHAYIHKRHEVLIALLWDWEHGWCWTLFGWDQRYRTLALLGHVAQAKAYPAWPELFLIADATINTWAPGRGLPIEE